MPLSVRLDPALESPIEQETRRLGISKSEFVKNAIGRVLGLKNPVDVLDRYFLFRNLSHNLGQSHDRCLEPGTHVEDFAHRPGFQSS